MAHIRVIVYAPHQANVAATANLYYHQRALEQNAIHPGSDFIGKFHPDVFARFLYNTSAQDTSSSAQETNVSFLGKFTQPQFTVLPLLRQQPENAVGAIAPLAETNTNFIGKFVQPQHNVLPGLRQNRPQDDSSSAQETNTHFIGTFTQPTFARFNYNHGEWVNSSFEQTNNIIGKFNPDKYQTPPGLYNTAAYDFSSSVPAVLTVEHNIQVVPYAIGQANPVLASSLYYWNRNDLNVVIGPQVDTAPHFIATFEPYVFNIIPPWGSVQDQSSSAQETNVHFIGKFNEAKFNVLAALRFQNDWVDSTFVPQTAETNTHFIARYAPVLHNVLPLLRSNIAADFSSTAIETNVSFLGRYTPVQHSVLAALRQVTAQDFSSTPPVITSQAVYNTMLLSIPGGMFSIPGNPPS